MILRWFCVLSVVLTAPWINSSELPERLDDWYQIELIIFEQSTDSGNDSTRDTTTSHRYRVDEDLVVDAPRRYTANQLGFSLRESERHAIFKNSLVVNFNQGEDPWFFSTPDAASSNEVSSEHQLQLHKQFPEWLIAPGESYDPFFTSTFTAIPFGQWFSQLSLAYINLGSDAENIAAEEQQEAFLLEEENLVYEGSLEEGDDSIPTAEEIEEALNKFEETLRETSYVLDENNVGLPLTAQRLEQADYRVIEHFRWHQIVPEIGAEEPILFNSNDRLHLTGELSLTKGRFIHLRIHLWWPAQGSDDLTKRYPVFELNEHRRVKREEVHYFDHPHLGALVEVKRIELPSDLAELIAALD